MTAITEAHLSELTASRYRALNTLAHHQDGVLVADSHQANGPGQFVHWAAGSWLAERGLACYNHDEWRHTLRITALGREVATARGIEVTV